MSNTSSRALLANVIAHRGASGSAPENTLAALKLAIDQGAKSAEIDVSISSDHIPFVHHDDTLDRCTNGTGLLSEQTAEALDKLDASKGMKTYSGEPLPRLQGVIELLAKHKVGLNLEIKPQAGLEHETVEAICKNIKSAWPNDVPLVFSSFSYLSLQLAYEKLPKVARGLLIEHIPEDWQTKAAAIECVNVHCDGSKLTESQAQEIKSAGYYLYCYTVNDVEKAKSLIAMGVDGLFTDYPDIMLGKLSD